MSKDCDWQDCRIRPVISLAALNSNLVVSGYGRAMEGRDLTKKASALHPAQSLTSRRSWWRRHRAGSRSRTVYRDRRSFVASGYWNKMHWGPLLPRSPCKDPVQALLKVKPQPAVVRIHRRACRTCCLAFLGPGCGNLGALASDASNNGHRAHGPNIGSN